MNIQQLVAHARNKDNFLTLQGYIDFCQEYLDFLASGDIQAVIVSQNENHYRFLQYNESANFQITRPINSNLMYTAETFQPVREQFIEIVNNLQGQINPAEALRRTIRNSIYTMQQSIGAALDALPAGESNFARKINGDLFERLIKLILVQMNIDAISGTIRVPVMVDGVEQFKMNYQQTSTNLDIKKEDAHEVLVETKEYFDQLFASVGKEDDADLYWLMLLCGAATLTIRGSDKSKVGKQVERVLVKSMLSILGFTLNENFWLNIQRDAEVGRETDAEVQTRRGRIRIEVGLISAGNQEVIEDKIARVGQNGVIIFDKIGEKSNIRPTAALANVNLIQIRNNNPIVELHRVLNPLVAIGLNPPPNTDAEIERAVQGIPNDLFIINPDDIENLAEGDDGEQV